MAKGRKTDVRAAIAAAATAKADEIGKWLDEVKDPARRLELFLRMLEYHIPKLSRAEVADESQGSVVIEIVTNAATAEPETDQPIDAALGPHLVHRRRDAIKHPAV